VMGSKLQFWPTFVHTAGLAASQATCAHNRLGRISKKLQPNLCVCMCVCVYRGMIGKHQHSLSQSCVTQQAKRHLQRLSTIAVK